MSKPGFWGYIARKGEYNYMMQFMNSRRLALVFDLDETLLVASSQRNFDTKIADLEKQIESESDEAKKVEKRSALNRVAADHSLLMQFILHDTISVPKNVKVEREELATLNPKGPSRIVFHLPDSDTILTRIDPLVSTLLCSSCDHLSFCGMHAVQQGWSDIICFLLSDIRLYCLLRYYAITPGFGAQCRELDVKDATPHTPSL